MKRGIKLLVALTLIICVCMGTAVTEKLYVKPDIESPLSLRDTNTNEVLTAIPAGTMLEPDGARSTDLFAYVTYGGYSGYVLWNYLTRTAPGGSAWTVSENASTGTVQATPEPAGGPFALKAVGAVIQRAAKRNKPTGEEMTETTVTPQDSYIITAKPAKGQKVDYWVINGVKYDFLRTFKWINMTAFDRSWTIEVAYKKAEPETLRSFEEIQAARNGSRLTAEVKNGEMCHLKEGKKGGGGWITSFDFTDDYMNRASNITEKGGQLSAKIRAKIPKGKKVSGWKLDGTEFYPATTVNDFIVRTLDTSMTYEPIFASKAEAKPTKKPTEKPDPVVQYYTVSCKGCSFSGGGYNGATSGSVPAGTKITVRSDYSEVNYWKVNGSRVDSDSKTITRTINSNTTVVCYSVIN